MGDLARIIIDVISFVWPFRLVYQWHRGGYYICGRFWRPVGPGLYPVVPWFIDVKVITAVTEVVGIERQDVTLQDKTIVSFSAAAKYRVIDYNLAMNTVMDHEHVCTELLAAVMADRMASVAAERVQPEKRGRLLADLTRWYQEEVEQFGIKVDAVYFTNFVLNPRIFRLIQDSHSTL